MQSSPKQPSKSSLSSSKQQRSTALESATNRLLQFSRNDIPTFRAPFPNPTEDSDTKISDRAQANDPREVIYSGMSSQVSNELSISPVTSIEDYVKSETSIEVPQNVSTIQLERLRAAMNVQLPLNQREKLILHSSDPNDVENLRNSATCKIASSLSSIQEMTQSPLSEQILRSPTLFDLETTSTESTTRTFQAGTTTPRNDATQTPSYPFPSMRALCSSKCAHRPFTTLSPTVNPVTYELNSSKFDTQDISSVRNTALPSEIPFRPTGSIKTRDDPMFETPNLYDLSLMLSSEPGLEAWWTTLVEILKNMYGAQRATLSVPADSTDIENVPWGQKATFNIIKDDKSKKIYLPRRFSTNSNSRDPHENSYSDRTSVKDNVGACNSHMKRPDLQSRHSFTAFEHKRNDSSLDLDAEEALNIQANTVPKTKGQFSTRADFPPRTRTLQNARLNLKSLEDHLVSEGTHISKSSESPQQPYRDAQGRVFTVLQALDRETDPLIDNKGISRVLQRGKVITLTRDYPYVEMTTSETDAWKKSCRSSRSKRSGNDKGRYNSPDIRSRKSFFGQRSTKSCSVNTYIKGIDFDTNLGDYTRQEYDYESEQELEYDEYEQAPASPWSQSPAPSPAVHIETSDNLFFTDMQAVDEETFNPMNTSPDYCEGPQPQTIGVDRSWTVLHVPLTHPLLSKPVQSFRLDAAALESKSSGVAKDQLAVDADDDKRPSSSLERKQGKFPIAILSLLTPLIPYPYNLRESLENLASHLATTFSLCRQFSNLETEIAGLCRKRPSTIGFGAVLPGTYRHYVEDPLNLEYTSSSPTYDGAPNRFTGGSLTSPSDYSGISKSNAGSPTGTPAWDSGNSGLSQEKHSNAGSPSCFFAESYFTNRSRPGPGILDTGKIQSSSNVKTWRNSKNSSSVDHRVRRDSRDVDEPPSDSDYFKSYSEQSIKGQSNHDQHYINEQETRKFTMSDNIPSIPDTIDPSSCQNHNPDIISHKRPALRTNTHQIQPKIDRPVSMHTLLHSYGADFGSTFQSLPATTRCRISTKSRTYNCYSSVADISSSGYMPPPSDRVKGILLDSLPLHLFIAMPPTGEIVWVNSRYLTYRGQSIENLHINPWGSLHPSDREAYLKSWKNSLRTGEQFAMQARLKRFDGSYRWFYTRASGLRDNRGVVVQWHGTSMDIHEQHVAEVKAARQEEIEASEAKHRRLANLIPQIIFSATEEDGITFANHQWLSFTGQPYDDYIGLGFIDYIHPEDLAKCHLLIKEGPLLSLSGPRKSAAKSQTSSPTDSMVELHPISLTPKDHDTLSDTIKNGHFPLSRTNSSISLSDYDFPSADFAELARSGVVKIEKDNDGQLSYSTEVRLRSKSGEYRWHLVRCVEVDDIKFGSGNSSWFGACADINDQKLLEMKLKEAMESKSKFLSNMSHEIRTPLIGISGMIGFLQDTILNDEQLDYCNTISSSAQGLLAIINDILDLAKADAGMIKLVYGWFHVRSLVEEVNETLSTMAITKHLEVNYVVDVDVPEMVKGDRFRIRQALLNVIGNAIKFTTIGEVFTRCRISPGRDQNYKINENEVMLEFSIIDTGKGFTQEEAEIIFKPFSQIDSSSTRSQGGTGLGLVISRQLVELHGGKMEGTAILGEGSTFTFTVVCGLPTVEDSPESPAAVKLSSSVSNLPKNPSLARTSTLSIKSKPPPNDMIWKNIGARKMTHMSEGSPQISENSFYSKNYSSGTPITSQDSDTSAAKHHLPDSSSMLTQSNPIKIENTNGTDPLALKLKIPNQNIDTQISRKNQVRSNNSKDVLNNSLVESQCDYNTKLRHAYVPVFSILLVCPQMHSREATTQHIQMTLSKDAPHQITALSSVEEVHAKFSGASLVKFTHIVLNLSSIDEIVNLIDQILSFSHATTSIVILTDPLQRQSVIKGATKYDYIQLVQQNRITFIFKPVKPPRFAVIFDPQKERDLSTDRNRSTAEQQVATQRQNYMEIGKRLGNKGLKVLLVEDNVTNQKVLLKFLSKVGMEVDLAHDGLECTQKVLQNSHSFYSLILCDLQMPNKDGYQACREIRAWEKKKKYKNMPIVALSANVMTDVVDRCNEAGFSNYITKPVDFKALSTVMGDYLDPAGSE